MIRVFPVLWFLDLICESLYDSSVVWKKTSMQHLIAAELASSIPKNFITFRNGRIFGTTAFSTKLLLKKFLYKQ